MLHITAGLFLIALGVWGIFDEWYYVVDCVKGGSSMLLSIGGAFAILAGLAPRRSTAGAAAYEDRAETISCDEGDGHGCRS